MVEKWDLKKKRHTTFFAIICYGFIPHLSMENCEKRCSYLKTNMKVWVQSSALTLFKTLCFQATPYFTSGFRGGLKNSLKGG